MQPLKVDFPMLFRALFSANVIDASFEQPKKAFSPIDSTESGSERVASPMHPEKVFSPIVASCDGDSKVHVVSFSHE